MLPVFLGLATVGYGVVVGLMNLAVWLALRAASKPTETALLLTILTGLQIPAGLGIIRCRGWGRQLAQALTLGIVIIAGLFTLQNAVTAPHVQEGILLPIVPIAISLMLNARFVSDCFGASGGRRA